MNLIEKTKFRYRLLTPLVLGALLASLFTPLLPPAQALDIQPLPLETAAASGFTHRATITWKDLTNATAGEKIIQLSPATGYLVTNTLVGPVAWRLTTSFTNAGGASMTNLMFNVGIGGNATTGLDTNQFGPALGLDIDRRGTNFMGGAQTGGPTTSFGTNLVVHIGLRTNNLSAYFSQRGSSPTLSTLTAGQIEIYWRQVRLDRLNP